MLLLISLVSVGFFSKRTVFLVLEEACHLKLAR